LLCFGACKKSVEGESGAWTKNEKKVKELQALYPGFKKALGDRLASAGQLMESAKGMGDEEAAADKMSAANKALMAGFVTKLGEVDKQVKAVQGKIVTAATKAGGAEAAGAKAAADLATRTLTSVENTLKAGAKDETGASAVLGKVLADLKAAEASLDGVIGAAGATKAQAGAAAAATKAAEAATKAAVAPWKCGYCGGSNDHKHTKCEGCGAARAAPKPAPKK